MTHTKASYDLILWWNILNENIQNLPEKTAMGYFMSLVTLKYNLKDFRWETKKRSYLNNSDAP